MATAAALIQAAQQMVQEPVEEPFVDKHFAEIAFAVSTLALLMIAPLDLFLGTSVGFGIHCYTEQSVGPNEKIVTLPNALFAIIGAIAALLRFTPGGAVGSFIFLAIPSIFSLSVGATLYRARQLCRTEASPSPKS